MNCFFDTSALVKLFHVEAGSDVVEGLVTDEGSDIWVCGLVRLEFLSSIYRRFREKELTDSEAEEVIQHFDEQLMSFNVEPLGSGVLNESEELMREYGKTEGLRSLDALHLAACRLIAEEDWVFVCSDARLCNVARKCGIEVNNPMVR